MAADDAEANTVIVPVAAAEAQYGGGEAAPVQAGDTG